MVLTSVTAGVHAQESAPGQGFTDGPAQEMAVSPDKTLTLRECMEYAVSNSTQVRIQQSKNDDARLDRRDAILKAFTPSVDGNSYGYYRWGRSIDPETNTYVTTTSLNQGFSVSAGISLFDGFSAINNLKITRTAVAMGHSQEQQERDKVCLATIEAYFNVIYYTKLAEILTEQTENARNAVKLAERQEELGSKGYADVVQMKADLADREYELTTAINNRDNALITLEDVMYWPVVTPIRIRQLFCRRRDKYCGRGNAVRADSQRHDGQCPPQPQNSQMAVPPFTRTLWRLVHKLLHLSGPSRLHTYTILEPVQE